MTFQPLWLWVTTWLFSHCGIFIHDFAVIVWFSTQLQPLFDFPYNCSHSECSQQNWICATEAVTWLSSVKDFLSFASASLQTWLRALPWKSWRQVWRHHRLLWRLSRPWRPPRKHHLHQWNLWRFCQVPLWSQWRWRKMLETRTRTRTRVPRARNCHWRRRLNFGERRTRIKDEASDAEEKPDLSHEEWQKVNGRFKTAMNKSQTAKDAWENASNLSKGNVQKAKRKAMVAWLMDPSFGKGFQQYIQTVSYDQRHTATEKPETFKQLLERYGEEEIEAMVDAWYSFSTCFLYLHCFKHTTSYLYTCQICWSDEWHLHMFTLNHC